MEDCEEFSLFVLTPNKELGWEWRRV